MSSANWEETTWFSKNQLWISTLTMNKQKMKLGNSFIHNSIQKNKILSNKFNQGEATSTHWKLHSVAESNAGDKWENMSCSWTRWFNIIKVAELPRIQCNPYRNPNSLFCRNGKVDSKFHRELQKTSNARTVLKGKKKFGVWTLSVFKDHYESPVRYRHPMDV